MPKNNKKKGAPKKSGAGVVGSRPPTDDENSTGDNWSTASVISDNSSACDLVSGEDQEVDDNTEQENFEDQLSECIEGLLSKSGPQRKKSLQGLKQAFCKKYCSDFLEKRKETVTDSVLKCLKKGKTDEQTLAAECIGLLSIQLGGDLSLMYADLQSALTVMLTDNSASVSTRAACASALAMCCFVTSDPKDRKQNFEEIQEKMCVMEEVFKKLYRKGDGTLPQCNAQMNPLNTSCMEAWTLLLSVTPSFFVQEKAETHLPLLGDLLQCADTDLRIAAGEAIAMLYDLNREIDEDFGGEDDTQTCSLCEQLKELSTESTKHIARNALREQRSRFRDILQTVETGEMEVEKVKVGRINELFLDDWSTKLQYKAVCNCLRSGIDIHLQENVFLREVFGLGPPLPVGAKAPQKMSKVQRKYYNSIAEKARTLSRGKNRDKRSTVMSY